MEALQREGWIELDLTDAAAVAPLSPELAEALVPLTFWLHLLLPHRAEGFRPFLG